MIANSTPSQPHPIQPYAAALETEHEENLTAGRHTRLTGLLHSHKPLRETGKVVVVRSAGPASPFGRGK